MLRIVTGQPDLKAPARIVDPDALERARLSEDECGACGKSGANAHHILPRGQGGDDVVENLIVLCGTGTMRCHGALHGNPYVDDRGRRWTGDAVRFALGRTIVARRPDFVRYLSQKLGRERAAFWLEGNLGIEEHEVVGELDPAVILT